jgi:hypothetical protein
MCVRVWFIVSHVSLSLLDALGTFTLTASIPPSSSLIPTACLTAVSLVPSRCVYDHAVSCIKAKLIFLVDAHPLLQALPRARLSLISDPPHMS